MLLRPDRERSHASQALSGLLFPVAAVGSARPPSESLAALRASWRSSGCILVVLEVSAAVTSAVPCCRHACKSCLSSNWWGTIAIALSEVFDGTPTRAALKKGCIILSCADVRRTMLLALRRKRTRARCAH